MNHANNYILPKSLLALLTVALLTGGSLAGPILDQSQLDHHNYAAIDDEGYYAQTFTPAITGDLDHVDLLIGDRWVSSGGDDYHLGPPTPAAWPAIVAILETVAGGAPSLNPADVLGLVFVDEFVATTYLGYHLDGYPVYADWNSIPFLAENVTLTAGPGFLLSPGPNPSSGEAQIAFRLRDAADATVTIYDLAGEELTTIGKNFLRQAR